MLINLTELFTLEGKEKTYTPDIEMKVYHGPYGDYKVVAEKPVTLRIINLGGKKLEVEGKAELTLVIPCDRCLEPVPIDLDFDIIRMIDLSESEEEREEDLDEQPYVNGYNLDVDQLVCDELILNLPMKVLCSENCKGICNRCGTNLNRETCDCDIRPTDPRMAVIQDIFKQFKEV
ncbi:YceD family protein [Lacrimispora aerotolerans]|jgi:uncharacterized protein|uniref:YceD family protein n=1 Tax=Lacrimispora aerotolerans TaxID=36832 RepID=UPI00047E0648|nr:DUF177 domain-containing protein [Lacrimispora aerotolerans]